MHVFITTIVVRGFERKMETNLRNYNYYSFYEIF